MKRYLIISGSGNRSGKSYTQIVNLMSAIREGKDFAFAVGGELVVYEAKKMPKAEKRQKPTQYDFDLLLLDELR